LLVVLTVGAIALGWYANRAWQQRRSVEAIIRQGGRVKYRSEGPSSESPLPRPYLARWLGIDFVDSVYWVDLMGDEFEDEDLPLLEGLPALERLQLYETQITGSGFWQLRNRDQVIDLTVRRSPLNDHGLESFRNCRLKSLNIGEADLTDAALGTVASWHDIETLFLDKMPITDRGIERLAGIESLRNVSLRRLAITDEALQTFTDHSNLVELKLRQNSLTDRGLQLLGQPPQLKFLAVDGTKISAEGIARFKAQYDRKVWGSSPPPATLITPPPSPRSLP
jgi:hypothetical protein